MKQMTPEERAQNLIYGITDGQYPRYLYKYWNIKSALRFLGNHNIKFSRYDEFNDPFECAFHLYGNYSDKEAVEYVLKNQNLENNEQARYIASTFSSNDIKNLVNDTIKGEILSSMGMFCLTETPDNLLMWVHYAEEHEGVCIKFDLLNDPYTFSSLVKMNYSSGFMNIDLLKPEKDVVELLHHKSVDWMYEKEYRILKEVIGLVEMKPSAISEIIFGCRTSEKDKMSIKEIVSHNPNYSIDYKQAAMHSSDYRILIIEENDKRITK